MDDYNIYSNPQGTLEAVKQGWSWPGFFFNSIWALVKKMWLLGGALTAIFIVLALFIPFSLIPTMSSMDIFINILSLIVSIVFGIKGNEWREANLQSRGYEFKGTVRAQNGEGAIATYFKDPSNVESTPELF
tara:strand:- start:12654 stop:13049 length:396 start_codon:yes stop_codon:yes gene_type:complete